MSKGTVAVSGITGFVGAQIVADLLAADYTVHGAARNPTPERLAHLTSLPGAAAFTPYAADLNEPGSFDEALRGCDAAVHCASVYTMDTVDAQKNIVDPAVNGTRAFLSACAAAGSVRKVVLTSSAAAVADRGRPGPAYTEEDWNTKSSIDFLPYFYSKVQAERAAWAWAEEHPDIKLVVINPFIVCGPSMVGGVNPSNELLRSMASGGFPGVVDLTLTLVDVRDVSKAHILALESDTAKGRYICCASEKPMHMRDVVKVLDSLGFPTKQMDLTNAFVTKTMRFLTGFSGKADMQYMHGHIGNPNLQNNAKIVADLGMTFMDPEDTIKDAMADMAKWGHLPPPKAD